jgi:tRNA pseudouridine55 synthase
MLLGQKTKSYDSETEVYETKPFLHLNAEMIRDAVESFLGESSQIPPMYSAVKHKGKPLYKLARKGQELERQPRHVNIKKFEVTSIDMPEVGFRVLCSKGTYIRTLISDLGEKLGTGAYLKELRRTKIGEFDIKDSVTVEEFINSNRN